MLLGELIRRARPVDREEKLIYINGMIACAQIDVRWYGGGE